MSTLKELKDATNQLIANHGEDYPVAFTLWTGEDVAQVAEDVGVDVTDEDCSGVIHIIHDDLDCNDGINWNVIESAIRDFKQIP